MKIYILLDEYLNSEHHCDFVDVFDSAEAVLKYISEHQTDGHKFKYETREFQDQPTGIEIDYPTVTPIKQPLTPGETYPRITWNDFACPPCFHGGPCTNPQHDCVNCPRQYCGGVTYSKSAPKSFSDNNGVDLRANPNTCTDVRVNGDFCEHTSTTNEEK